MNRLSRILVLLSLLAATALEAHLAAPEYGPLVRQTSMALALGIAGGLVASRPSITLAFALAYIAPVLLTVMIGRFRLSFLLLWNVFLLGVMVSPAASRGWSLPAPWRWPVVFWAVAIALTWPIVVWREVDFDMAMLWSSRVSNTQGGVTPAVAVLGILDGTCTQLLGLLFFDWLFQFFGTGPLEQLHRVAIRPLWIGLVLASLLASYQGFIDVSLWSAGQWATLRRAAGGMLDANASGMIAAMWFPVLIAFAGGTVSLLRRSAIITSTVLAAACVWTSGSRTALLAVAVGTAVFALDRVRAAGSVRQLFLLGTPMVVAAIVLFSLLPSNVVGPLERVRDGLRGSGVSDLGDVALSLWNRDGYGIASTRVIRENPWTGAGVGAFTLLSADYARFGGGPFIPYDNAQNWFRHQLAELGALGSVGWLVWAVLFGLTLARTRGEGLSRPTSMAIKGSLLGIAAASMLGVPTQSFAVALTFWLFAFWYLRLVAPANSGAALSTGGGMNVRSWALMTIIVAAFAVGTVHVGADELSVPARAQRFGWDYEHGFYETGTAEGRQFRYTHQRAAAVVAKAGRILRLRIWTDDPSAAANPVPAKVWIDGRLVLDAPLQYRLPVSLRIPMLVDEEKLLIRTWIARTWRREAAGAEPRDIGLAVDWTFDK